MPAPCAGRAGIVRADGREPPLFRNRQDSPSPWPSPGGRGNPERHQAAPGGHRRCGDRGAHRRRVATGRFAHGRDRPRLQGARASLLSSQPDALSCRRDRRAGLADPCGISWYEEQRVRLLLGTEAAAIDLQGHVVELHGGEKLPFDKLLLAAGAHPFIPPLPGADREGVTSLRTVDDARRILAAVPGRREVRVHRRRPAGPGNGGRPGPARGRRDAPGRPRLAPAAAVEPARRRNPQPVRRSPPASSCGPRPSRGRSSAGRPTARGSKAFCWKTAASLRPNWW